VSVAESNAAVLEALDAVVVERDAIDVAREIAQSMLAGADVLHVHDPPLVPHCRIDLLIQTGTGEGSAQLRAKEAVRRRRSPGVSVPRHAAAGEV